MMKKKFRFLSLLLLGLFTLVGFGYCDNAYIFTSVSNSSNYFSPGDCWLKTNRVWGSNGVKAYDMDGNLIRDFSDQNNNDNVYGLLYCMNFSGYLLNNDGTPFRVENWVRFSLGQLFPECPECPECQQCPEINTGDILSGYIAISDVNDSYCISNGLCGEVSTGLSQLFINDIRHESMPFINITIPEEFNRNYNYTGNGTQFDLNVLGYNTDSDYIAGIIETQKSTPNDEDLNNIISGILPLFVPGIVIILFLYFVFRFVKKVF